MRTVDSSAPPERIGTIDETTRVLIVEDHGLVAEGLAFALVQAGLHAESVRWQHPGEILERTGLGPGLVLLDLDLCPGFPGDRLVAPLRDRGFTVVVLTAVTDRLRLAACLEAGAAAVTEKSDSFDDVLDVIGRALRGEPVLGARAREELFDELHRHRAAVARRMAPFTQLTRRERELLDAILHGKAATVIAGESGVSLKTVRAQTSSLLQKLGVHSQLAAAALARRAGWVADNGAEPVAISSIDPMR